MKLYKYWAEGSAPAREGNRRFDVQCYGGSNVSVEDALRAANERASRIAQRIAVGGLPDPYGYSHGRPMREEIIEEFAPEGQVVAALSRNSYGSVVLNTPHVMFADIDLPPRSIFADMKASFLAMFGRHSPSPEDKIVERVRKVADDRRLGLRLYRTHSGFRCLVRTRTFDPTSDEAQRLLDELGSDQLYKSLCRTQECFRARVSPKPWRIGEPKPPVRFPWKDAAAEQAFRDWAHSYDRAARRYAVCAFIGDFGERGLHPEVRPIMEIHDRMACAAEGALA